MGSLFIFLRQRNLKKPLEITENTDLGCLDSIVRVTFHSSFQFDVGHL